jgi:hypothetical protein
MLLYLEIAIVVISFLVLGRAMVRTGRQALVTSRTAKGNMGRMQPKIDYLKDGADAASHRGMAISDRVALLQERVFVLGATGRKFMVLISALKDAQGRISPMLRYIGL